ncbi:MAG: amphi-Trp domain-containing protein [Spirochaetaceae bacterium]
MSGKKEVLHKSQERMKRSELAAFLRDLASRVESGSVVLKSSSGETSVDIPDQVDLELEYEVKQKKSGERKELELEITWGPDGGVDIA